MAHKRTGSDARRIRQRAALVRWQENQARNYRGILFRNTRHFSHPDYVDGQMTVLREKLGEWHNG